jgi:hypothetical protein
VILHAAFILLVLVGPIILWLVGSTILRAGRAIVGTRRTKRGRGLSGLAPRELSTTDELLAEHRAEAAREDRGPE